MQKKWIILVALISIPLIILLLPTLFNFCYNLNNADVEYHLEIQGLAGISTSNQPVTILVPLPLMNDRSAFSNTSFTAELDGWNSSVVSTEYGQMLSFTATSYPLKDIDAWYGLYNVFVVEVPVSRMAELRFSPEIPETPTPYSVHYVPYSGPVVTPAANLSEVDVPPGAVLAVMDPLPIYDRGTHYRDRTDSGPTLIHLPETSRFGEEKISVSITYRTNSKYGDIFAAPNNMKG